MVGGVTVKFQASGATECTRIIRGETENEHRTFNTEHRSLEFSSFDVGRSMFDVGRSKQASVTSEASGQRGRRVDSDHSGVKR